MQETESTSERTLTQSPRRRSLIRRLLPISIVLFLMIVLAVVLPLININRYQRRIVASLSESLGRPIHLDRISLTVLPLPGFTIENLVVGEDPAFGSEPFVRASAVRARLRISSLWRRRIEFTRISLTDPSINLVKTPQGKWNLESILVQAARIEAAPTAQARASSAPRFPYIEATGARLNLKLGDGSLQEKTPISLTEADLALWLNSPQEWRLRLDGRPVRTDIVVSSDTGTLRMEGTLGRATALNDVPIDLRADWNAIPLGEATKILMGGDAGLRGSMSLSAHARGTVGRSSVQTTLHLADLRRADFVPQHPLSLDLECQAGQTGAFRSLTDLRCSWPAVATPPLIALTGTAPDLSQPGSTALQVGARGLPAATLLDWLRVASPRIDPLMTATGLLSGSLSHPAAATLTPSAWDGQLTIADGTLTIPSISDQPIVKGNLNLRASRTGAQEELTLAPISFTLGDHEFATLDGLFSAQGSVLHLAGTATSARLLALGTALPQIGDGLADALPEAGTPTRFDLTSTRPRGGAQVWHTNTRNSPKPTRR